MKPPQEGIPLEMDLIECDLCHGTGEDPDDEDMPCPECYGDCFVPGEECDEFENLPQVQIR